MTDVRKCVQCGKLIKSPHLLRKVCSERCRRARRIKQMRAWRIRRKAGRRPPHKRNKCHGCGRRFAARNCLQRYCREKCRAESERQRRKKWRMQNVEHLAEQRRKLFAKNGYREKFNKRAADRRRADLEFCRARDKKYNRKRQEQYHRWRAAYDAIQELGIQL